MKVTKSFNIQDLVSRKTYNMYQASSVQFLSSCSVYTLQEIADYFGKRVMVNTWADGGEYLYRGFRHKVDHYGKEDSQHCFGRAFDFVVCGLDSRSVFQAIKRRRDELFPLIGALHGTPDKVHFDTRFTVDNKLIIF